MPLQWTCAAATLLVCGCSSQAPVSLASAAQSSPRTMRVAVPPGALNQANLPQRALAVHNRYRAAVGAPPLQWDAQLAAGAQSYARELAATGRFAHSVRSTRPGVGENLWTGTAGAYSLETMLAHWGEERTQVRPGIFPAVSRTGNWMDVAHYTQMVWRTTTRVGCSLQSNRGSDYLVCRYSPAGNRDGVRVP